MIRVFTDGACQPNPGNKGIGVVIEWQNSAPEIISKGTGFGSNNQAEYEALLEALMQIRDKKIMKVEINSDSNLMVNQVNGNWACKDKQLRELCTLAQRRIDWLIQNGYDVKLVYIRREFNLADNPAKNGVSLNV